MTPSPLILSVSPDEGLCGRNVLIYLTLCYVHCSISSLFAISHVAMSLYSIINWKTVMIYYSNWKMHVGIQLWCMPCEVFSVPLWGKAQRGSHWTKKATVACKKLRCKGAGGGPLKKQVHATLWLSGQLDVIAHKHLGRDVVKLVIII